MSIPIAPGVYDILPDNPEELWKSSFLWQYIEGVIRTLAHSYGFRELRTPIFERTELFQRSVGEATDIVSKEMYTFKDKGDRLLSLRPEGTAPAMRAFLDSHLLNTGQQHKLYYISPMFRYERAQAGRYRQHHQFGVEAIGVQAPEQDAEVIDLLYTLFCRLGLKNLTVNINSIGDVESRSAFKALLQDYLKQHFDALSPDSQQRFHVNPLRILDSKAAQDQAIVANAPSILDALNSTSRDHFEEVKKLLTLLGIPFRINPLLVRGLDYYNYTVFEVTANELGAQNSVGGGGRYDGLLKSLGGPDLPSCGFGCGLERLIQTMLKQQVQLPTRHAAALYIIPLGQAAKESCFPLLRELREQGIAAEMDFSGRKLGKSMQYANQIGAQYVTVVGDNELQAKEIEIKEMSSGNKSKVSLEVSALVKVLAS